MSKKQLYYKIGEACKLLDIQPYVLRYWEKEFPLLSPNKSRSGQRVYSAREIEVIRRIKELLYEEGYTIAGAKKKLEGELAEGELGSVDATGADDAADSIVADSAVADTAVADSAGVDSADTAVADSADADGTSGVSALAAPPPSANGGGEAAAGEVDTGAAEEIQKLRSGVAAALSQAREILRRIESAEL